MQIAEQPFVATASLFLIFRLGRLKLHSDILFSKETRSKSMRLLPCMQTTWDLYFLYPVKIHILMLQIVCVILNISRILSIWRLVSTVWDTAAAFNSAIFSYTRALWLLFFRAEFYFIINKWNKLMWGTLSSCRRLAFLHVILVSDCAALIKNIAMAIAIETFKLASLLTNPCYWSQQGLFHTTPEESKWNTLHSKGL